MKKRIFAFISVLLLITLPLLTSCGYSANEEAYTATTSAANGYNYYVATEEMDMVYDVAETVAVQYSKSDSGSSVSNTSSSTIPTAGRKIIYNSSFDIETKEYETSVSALNALCEKHGAYFENSNTYGTKETSRRSSYTVRVPVENYRAFTGEAESIGVVISSSENNKDVTEEYYDSEARLESAKIREERVLEILKNAGDLDDVLALERELADIRYEIESYTGTLRKYDSLVSFSTVQISIREVRSITEPPKQVLTFGERVSVAFSSGINNFVEGVQSFIIYLSYNLIGVTVSLIIVITVLILVISSIKKRREIIKKFESEAKENPSEAQDENNKK